MSFFSDKSIKYKNIDASGKKIQIPDFCQFENRESFFKPIWYKLIDEGYNSKSQNQNPYHLICVYQCASCKKYIAIEYCKDLSKGINIYSKIKYDWSSINPDWPFDDIVTKVIQNVSPSFIKTYKEANIAEKSNLHQIDIMGYRKATEILINDVLKYYNHSDDELKKMSLNQKINKLPSYKIKDNLDNKNISRLIAWIGNDGTHVYEKNPQYGLKDMKFLMENFINTIIRRIKMEQYDKYVKNKK